MYIEFIGLPGAGKTTCRTRLLDALREAGDTRYISSETAFLQAARRDVDPVFRRPLRILPQRLAFGFVKRLINRTGMQYAAQNLFLAQHGLALVAFLRSQTYCCMSIADKERVIGSFLTAGALLQCIGSVPNPEEVVFFEEGLLQKSLMFVDHGTQSAYDPRDVQIVQQYLENIPLPDLVVYVSASTKVSLTRMLGRKSGLTDRLKDAESGKIEAFLTKADDHLAVVSAWLSEKHSDRLFVLNSENNSAEEFSKLLSSIRNLSPA